LRDFPRDHGRPEDVEHRDRSRARLRAALRPSDPRRGVEPARAGVHQAGRDRWRVAVARDPPPRAAQRDELGDGAGQPDDRGRDHCRGVAVLSWRRGATAGAGVGLDAGRRTVDADGRRLVAHSLPRSRHRDGGAGDAATRRLAAGAPRPAAAQPVTRMASVLQVTELQTHYVTFGGARVVKAVDRVSFALNEGECLGIVGESGCGKTTTCQSIVGVLPAAARIVGGSIAFMGEELTRKRPREMRRIRGARIAMILQDPMASLNPLFSIYRQVAEPAYYHHAMRGRSLRERVRELLNAVRIPSPAIRMLEYPHQMSGGMRQRIVGAIALAGGPKLIMADEPTTNLDVTIQAQYLDLLKDLQQQTGIAIIFVTHNLGIVARMCDRLAVMYAGRIVEAGTVRQLFDAPQHPYTKALLRSMPKLGSKEPLSPIPGQPPPRAGGPPPSTRVAQTPAHAVPPPRPTTCAAPPAGARAAGGQRRVPRKPIGRPMPPLLEAEGLAKHFPSVSGVFPWRRVAWVKAVDGVDFTVEPGETLGVIGESGCGKTTTAKLILLQEIPTAGVIRFDGKVVAGFAAAELMRYRREVQVVFQAPYSSLSPRMRVGEIIAEPLQIHTDLPRSQQQERVAEVLELVGLRPDGARLFPHEFSGG